MRPKQYACSAEINGSMVQMPSLAGYIGGSNEYCIYSEMNQLLTRTRVESTPVYNNNNNNNSNNNSEFI